MRKRPQFLFNLISIYLRRSFEIDLINISVVHLCGSVKRYSPGRLLDLSSLTPLISGPRGWRTNFPAQSPVLLQFSVEQDPALHFMFHILLNDS